MPLVANGDYKNRRRCEEMYFLKLAMLERRRDMGLQSRPIKAFVLRLQLLWLASHGCPRSSFFIFPGALQGGPLGLHPSDSDSWAPPPIAAHRDPGLALTTHTYCLPFMLLLKNHWNAAFPACLTWSEPGWDLGAASGCTNTLQSVGKGKHRSQMAIRRFSVGCAVNSQSVQ